MSIEFKEHSFIYHCFVSWTVASNSNCIGLQLILDYGRKDFKAVRKCVTSLREIFQHKVDLDYFIFILKNMGTFTVKHFVFSV